jgi:hypothetical protein
MSLVDHEIINKSFTEVKVKHLDNRALLVIGINPDEPSRCTIGRYEIEAVGAYTMTNGFQIHAAFRPLRATLNGGSWHFVLTFYYPFGCDSHDRVHFF